MKTSSVSVVKSILGVFLQDQVEKIVFFADSLTTEFTKAVML